MSKTKKLLIALMLLIAVLLIPNMVNAARVDATETTQTSTGIEVKWSYELDDSNNIINLKCTNITSVTGELTIPATIDGYNVTNIAGYAFEDCTGLTGIVLPNNITSIGNGIFRNCSGLTSISLPTSITQIPDYSFRGCSGLANITLPSGITSIGKYAFESCTGLTNIALPDSVTTLGNNAFENCSSLNNITLSRSLTKLNICTFEDCSSLTEIVLPNNLTTISGGGWMDAVFKDCVSLKFIKIPEKVVSISDGVFYGCSNFTIYGAVGSVAETYAQNNNINFENIENWDNRNQNAGADITAPTVSKMEIKYSSVMDYYNSTTNDFRIPKNAEIIIIVEFSETLTGTTTPTLTIKCGTGNNVELKNGTISGEKIVYTYTIKESDEGLITVVSLTGGNVTDAARNNAVLTTKELKVEYNSNYAYAEGSKVVTDDEPEDTKKYISFPFIIYFGTTTIDLKQGAYDGEYTMYYQFVEVTNENEETNYDDTKWIEMKDRKPAKPSFEYTGEKKFDLWIKLEMEDETVYESYRYKFTGTSTVIDEAEEQDKPTTTDKDTTKDDTTAKDELPKTGRVLLFWIIGIVTVSGTAAYVRYKKLYM